MPYDNCREQLRALLDSTSPHDPIDKADALQKIATAYALINWATRKSIKAFDQFTIFASLYERFAFGLEGTTRSHCEGELMKLIVHLPKDEENPDQE